MIDLAGHLGVSIKKYFKKQQILDEIIAHLVNNEMLEEEAMEYVSKEEVSEAIKIKQMELELQREIEERERKKKDYCERKTRKRYANTRKRNSVTERN